MSTPVELILDAHALLGEGPCWHEREQKLYWVDINGKALHCYDPATATDQVWEMPGMTGCVAPCESGGFLVGVETEIARFTPATGAYEILFKFEQEGAARRFNDGKCDPHGRFWAGTMEKDNPRAPRGMLYRLDPDRIVHTMETNVTVSNGLTWNPEGTVMYYIDTPTHQIVAYDYHAETGVITGKRVVVQIQPEMGHPDGMTADQEGMLWVALWDGWKVSRWNPKTGKLLATYDVPVKRASACCFGGSDLQDLYITTAQEDSPQPGDSQPHAGGLFRLRTDVPGIATFMFKG